MRPLALVLLLALPARAADLTKENTIYLTDLRLQDAKLKAGVLIALKDVIAKANAGFTAKGLPTRVVLLEDVAQATAASSIKPTSVVATIGDTPGLVKVQADLEKKGFDEMTIENMGPEKGSAHGAARFLPNGDYAKDTDRGDRLVVNLDALDIYLKTFAIGENDFIAWLIQHGSIHNAGLSHNNEPNYRSSSGFENVPDLTTSGQYYLNHKDKFATHRDAVSEKLRGLYTSAGKFKKN